jgi:hypothetical protein
MELARIFHGKKYMWDGKTYSDLKEAEEIALKYRNDHFEVETITEGGQYFVFTRRVAAEVKA